MFRKFFTNRQLSAIFQSALLLHIMTLLVDLITYHFFPDHTPQIEFYFNICHELGLFILCLIIISQAIIIFSAHHQKFVTRHRLIALTTEIALGLAFFWLLTIDNDIQANFIEFISSVSIGNRNYKILTTYFVTLVLVIMDFYQTLENPEHINAQSIPEIIRSTIRFVIGEYALIFLSLFSAAHFAKLHAFAITLLNYSKSTITNELTLLQIIIPSAWIGAMVYYIYYRLHKKKTR